MDLIKDFKKAYKNKKTYKQIYEPNSKFEE